MINDDISFMFYLLYFFVERLRYVKLSSRKGRVRGDYL
jgi:hypothetical protein